MTLRQILTHRLVAVIALLLIMGIGAPLLWPKSQAEPAEALDPSPRLLPVASVFLQPATSFSETMSYTGLVEADQVGLLGFERGGRLEVVFVDEGDAVKQGQRLALLDQARLQLDRQALLAEKAGAEAILQEMWAGTRAERILAQKATVQELHARSTQTRQEAKRQEALLDDGVSSQEHAGAFRSQATAANSRLEAAQHLLAEMEAGTRPEQIQAQEAALALLHAKLDKLALELERTVLSAPYSGSITKRLLDPGVVMDAGTPLLSMQSNSAMKAKIGIPDALASEMTLGSKQTLRIGADDISATISALLPQVNRQTRSRIVVLDIPPGQTIPGRTAEWLVPRVRETNGFWVPSTALLPGRRGLWAVLLLNPESDGTFQVRRQEVQILHTETNRVLLRADALSPNDQVIAKGVDRVVPGQMVRLSTRSER